MLEALKKILGDKPVEATQEQESNVEAVVTESIQETFQSQLAVAQDMIAAYEENIQELNSKLEDMVGKLAQYEQIAKEAEANAEAIRIAAEEKAIQDRKEMLSEVIGADNTEFDSVFAAISQLNDDAFATVVSGFAASRAKEAVENEMMNEVGVSGEATVSEVKENATMRIIKQTYQK